MSDPVFFAPARALTIAELAQLVDGHIVNTSGSHSSDAVKCGSVAPLDSAQLGQLTFLDNPKYLPQLAVTAATACLIAERYVRHLPASVIGIVCREPYRALATIMQALFPDATRLRGSIDPAATAPQIAATAIIHPTARLEAHVVVEPGAVIGAHAEVGHGTVICAYAVIGHNVRIGRDGYVGSHASIQCALIGNRVILHPGVRIGQDGFGFAMGAHGHMKMPQVGRVIIQDDVEIGANSCIDRGANRDTVIGEGTKIDNLVQVGHNVTVGRHAVIVAQVGIAGSSRIGDFAALGGQAGISGHVTIGQGARVAGHSGVANDIPPGQEVIGTPAKELRAFMRERLAIQRLVTPKGDKKQ